MLKSVMEKFEGLAIFEERSVEDDNVELVILNSEIDQWSEILENLFGSPIKPVGSEPSKKDLELTKDLGGISMNQTLYQREFSDVTILSMLWPWGNNTQTTLNMVLIRKDTDS